jgi:hypothetical protein
MLSPDCQRDRVPYLDPPPFPAPVIVQKDVGGYVADYKAATERYRAEDREVQLHECRSACTLALSLPGVCVYPTSILKFHKAYDVNTKVADEGISEELFSSYPPAVQAKLGTLTRGYKVLTGAELIALGMRNCAESRVQYARRTGNSRIQVAAARPPAAQQDIGAMFQSVLTAMAKPFEAGAGAPPAAASSTTLAAVPAAALAVPLPPRRPAELAQMELAALETPSEEGPASHGPGPAGRVEAADPPLPLPRPLAALPRPTLPVPGMPRLMSGAQPVLPSDGFGLSQWAGR